jgi:hypothetical protein
MVPRDETTEGIAEMSPLLKARIAGGLYLIVIGAGAFSYGFVRSAIITPGEADATAANILAHQLLYRLGFVAVILLLLCNVPLALIFFDLFKVVRRNLAALVAFFILVATAIEAVTLLNYFAPLILLGSGHRVSAFKAEQLHALAYIFLELQAIGFNVAVVFFAFYDLLIAYLVVRSIFLPRVLGLLMAIGGICYLTNSFANFLSSGFAAFLFPYILVPSGVAELSLCLWLLVLGVNGAGWEKQAAAAGTPMKTAAV